MFYLIIFVFLLVLAEFSSYIWHKYGAHTKIIPEIMGVQSTHRRHHTIIDDEAHEDFAYIALFLVLYLISLSVLYWYKRLSWQLFAVLYLPFFILSVWTWYIHSAYHIKDHWLNRYEWFQNDKRIHFQHHENPKTNYGISSHVFDVVFETFDYGLLGEV